MILTKAIIFSTLFQFYIAFLNNIYFFQLFEIVNLLQIDVGLGKGKPYTVSSKVAKKKMSGYKLKGGYSAAGKLGFQKRQRSGFPEFGRKRGSKPKMRGVFGVPGLGLQRPQAPDCKAPEDDPGK